MTALYRKELRTLLPLQILMILSHSGDVLYRPLTQRLDEKAWTDISSYIEPGEGSEYGISILVFIVAAIGHNLIYGLFGLEDPVSLIISLASGLSSVLATAGGMVVFLKGRQPTT